MYVNIFSVLLAAVLGFGVSAFWYSPYLFGKQWRAAQGASEAPSARFSQRQTMAIELAATLVTSFVLANLALALGVHGPLMAVRLAFWVWIGFQATLLFSAVVFERRPMQLFYINAGHRLAQLLIMSLVVGLWR